MGKKNSQINTIIDGKIDLSAGVSILELKKGEKVWLEKQQDFLLLSK
jgi:mannose-6-phosphate isomerase class I